MGTSQPAVGANDEARPLAVGIKEAPPFSVKGDDGRWRGLSVELWEAIAADQGYEFEWRQQPLDELLANVEAGKLDLAVGALTVTPQREEQMDFTHAIYQSGYAIALRGEGGATGWLATLRGVLSWQFIRAVAALLGVLLLAGAAMWWFEHKKNRDHFGGDMIQGLGEGLWWSAVTMTTVGYGDRVPVTRGGRIVALIWMFTSIIIISGFTATIAASLTMNQMKTSIDGLADLRQETVATLKGSTSEAFLEREKIGELTYYDSIQAGLDAVVAGEVRAMVYDAPILSYLLTQRPYAGRLALIKTEKQPQVYAFALPEGSSLKEPVNRSLLRQLQSSMWRKKLAEYGL